jgi:hypothetical protein
VQSYKGSTAGLGYLEVNVICPCKSPHWIGWLVSALSIPSGENGAIPLLTLTLTTITSVQLQNKQASIPPHVHITSRCNPQAELLYVKCTRLNPSLWNKKEWHWPSNIKKCKTYSALSREYQMPYFP